MGVYQTSRYVGATAVGATIPIDFHTNPRSRVVVATQTFFLELAPQKLGKMFTQFDLRIFFRWVETQPPTSYKSLVLWDLLMESLDFCLF